MFFESEETMNAAPEMKLPELEQRYTRAYYMPKEWIIDPAVLRRFDDIIPRRSFHPVTRNAPRHFLRHRDEQRHERFI